LSLSARGRHLVAQATGHAPAERSRWKLRLVKGLYRRGLTAEQVRQLYRLIDWMVQLPKELQEGFREEVYRFEEEARMPYVTSTERMARKEGLAEGIEKGRQEGVAEGRQEGRAEGLQEAVALALEAKLGTAGKRLASNIRALRDADRLRMLARAVPAAESLDAVKGNLR
jgi:flagellar biosynthesis/type III secretory pathway protein FliH